MKKLLSFAAVVAVGVSLVVVPSVSAVELEIGPEYSPERRAVIMANAERLELAAKERALRQANGEYDKSPHSFFSARYIVASDVSSVEKMWDCWKDYPHNFSNPFFWVEDQGVPPINDERQWVECPLLPITDKDREVAAQELADGSAVQSSPGVISSLLVAFWRVVSAVKSFLGLK